MPLVKDSLPPGGLADFEKSILVRSLRPEDFAEVTALQLACFQGMKPWTRDQYDSQMKLFSEGQFGVEYEGKLVATASSLIVDYDHYSDWHDWNTISDDGMITNHDPDGDMLYGIEIMVHPEYRGMKLARRLYEARKDLVKRHNLKGIVIGGRIPGFVSHKGDMTVHEYIENVEDKTLFDPVLTVQLANGFELKQLISNYLPSDAESVGWATHMEWTNVDYRPYKKRAIQPVQIVRMAAVQYMMRSISSFDDFEQQVTYFVDTTSDYKCDFVLFPELFTTQLLSFCGEMRPGEAARRLAEFTPQYLELFNDLAIRYHINIVAGSQFTLEEEYLYNIAYLFRRDGSIDKQYKIHITPAEWKWWGVTGGERVEVFDTDCGKVAILICYDVEFPELARIAAQKGARILFVPYNTDEQFGHLRVRYCAQARCIENHQYVVAAGCTGNLPFVNAADIHYAQSAIYTPADIPFSPNAVAAETTPNVETIIMKDLDVEALRRHKYKGTTLNWQDRRRDLYQLHYMEDGSWKRL